MNLWGRTRDAPRKNPTNVGVDLDKGTDPGIFITRYYWVFLSLMSAILGIIIIIIIIVSQS